MEQYISKSALVAEIERLRKNNEPKENMQYAQFALDVACGYDMALDDIEASINTLEVKEIGVDVGSLEGDWGSKTVQFIDADGNIKEIAVNKAQKGEQQ